VKILIAGAGGQVGGELVRSAPERATIMACPRAELDITDERAVMDCIRRHAPEVVINAAAYTAVDRAESEPELARQVNAEGPRYLALAAREVGARLLHLSTDFVFDGASSVPYSADAATNPLNVYGATKRAGEASVAQALPERSVILRTAWVYAAHGHNFVRTMLRIMRASGSVRVVADQTGTPTSARSVAETIWKLVALPHLSGIYHWTDAGTATWYDFAVAIKEEGARLGLVSADVTVVPIATHEYVTAARRPSYSVLDNGPLVSLGMAPLHWRERLRSVLAEIRNG
jgi:dTDP-4-dehydrorhamnose reductase